MTGPSATARTIGPAEARGFSRFTSESLTVGGRAFTLRRAASADVAALVALLRDDVLGESREGPTTGTESEAELENYRSAFALIDADPNQLLLAVEEACGPVDPDAVEGGVPVPRIVGTLQLSLLPGLSRRGTTRLQIEAVRIDPAAQGIGLGTAVFDWAHDCGRRFGAGLAQLTTDKSRRDAHRFYDRLGYTASHEGLKLELG